MFLDILFIFCISVFMIYESSMFVDPTQGIILYDNLRNKDKTSDERVIGCLYGAFHLFYFLFIIFGIAFGTQWLIYTAYFAFSLLAGFIRGKLTNRTAKLLHYRIDALVSFMFLFMILIYHFNRDFIDILNLINQWI